jgi:predicted methyltransferase
LIIKYFIIEKGIEVMITMKRTSAAICLILGMSTSGIAAVDAGFMDALGADARPADAKARDGIRRPAQVMELLGVDAGMTVVDVEALGGWYTEVLSAAVGPNGKVIAQVGPRALQQNDGAASTGQATRLGNVEVTFDEIADVAANSADAALTALNLHDHFLFFGGESGVTNYLQSIYNVLKPGGLAAIIDHEGDNIDLHRFPAADAKAYLEQVGFEIVTESDLLHTNADDHTVSPGDPSLARHSDRFLFIVRKP